ncbi:MAG: hypothetical protein F4137_15300 [Acidobacteria bacterium]|nr:hypothetical protein [Acidobacteriota bacterium]
MPNRRPSGGDLVPVAVSGVPRLLVGWRGQPAGSRRSMSRSSFRFSTTVLVCVLALPAAAQVPPDEAWRSVDTEHFRITFPAQLEEQGRRVGELAERAYRELTAQFREGPSGRIDVVLTDHVDLSNGYARIWPSNRIVLYARPPADHLALAYFDDWFELLVTHELAHIFHLDYGGTLGRIFRTLFGRAQTPLTFPGVVVPGWVAEGLATWYESALTGAGRVHGTFHEMVLRTAALEGRFENIGQASGNSRQWPGGTRRYAYGSLFFDYLLDKHGRESMAAFVEAVVRPATQLSLSWLNAAGRRAFGASLSSEWAAWTNELRAGLNRLDGELAAFGPITEPEALTRNARYGLHPMRSRDGGVLVYVRSDGRSYPRLVVMPPDGGDPTTVTRINNRAPFDVLPSGGIVFAQRDYTDRYRVFSDVHVATVDGAVRRVTRGARLTAPSAGPDGTWAVAVAEGEGTNGLARVDLLDGSIRTLAAPHAGTYWAYPAVSPDGRRIAASRWTERRHDVVVLDADGRVTHEVTRDRALDLAPKWSADGRYLVWSSDRSGILNILGAEVDPLTGAPGPPVMLTNVRTGAAFPSVDPAGEWLYFSGYHVDGWEVERVRFAPDAAPPAPAPAARFDDAGASHVGPAATGASIGDTAGTTSRDRGSPSRDYSPASTLYPRYWFPVIREPVATAKTTVGDVEVPRTELLGYALGGRTSGIDLVGRHAYEAGAQVFTSGGRGEGDVSYEYRGLGNPTIGVTASQTWDDDGVRVRRPEAGAAGSPEAFFVLERERRLATSVRVRRPGVRLSTSLRLSAGLVRSDREVLDDVLRPTDGFRLTRPGSLLSEYAVSFSVSSARSHAFQMGNARGAALYLRARTRGDLDVPGGLAGRDAVDLSVDDLIGRVRAYIPLPGPGFAAPVLAVRASGGTARGPGAQTGYFGVGGAAGDRVSLPGAPTLVGGSVFLPVRGYETSTQSGRTAWSTSVELRVPLALVNRGRGTLPLHVDRVFGSVFLDGGNAWGRLSSSGDESPRPSVLLSAGFEVSTDLLALYGVPLRLRAGAAFPFIEREGPRYYVRVCLPF